MPTLLRRQVECGIASVVRQRQHVGEKCDVLARCLVRYQGIEFVELCLHCVGKMYLTGILPVTSSSVANAPANQWQANANGGTSLGTMTSYAINVLFKPPTLTCTNLSPAAPGATITINGGDFVRNMKVRFGTTDVPATISTVLQATVTVPTDLSPGATQISAVVGDVATSSCPFTVLP